MTALLGQYVSFPVHSRNLWHAVVTGRSDGAGRIDSQLASVQQRVRLKCGAPSRIRAKPEHLPDAQCRRNSSLSAWFPIKRPIKIKICRPCHQAWPGLPEDASDGVSMQSTGHSLLVEPGSLQSFSFWGLPFSMDAGEQDVMAGDDFDRWARCNNDGLITGFFPCPVSFWHINMNWHDHSACGWFRVVPWTNWVSVTRHGWNQFKHTAVKDHSVLSFLLLYISSATQFIVLVRQNEQDPRSARQMGQDISRLSTAFFTWMVIHLFHLFIFFGQLPKN